MKTPFVARQITLLFVFLLISIPFVEAAKVDTVLTVSESMKKKIKAVVVTPDSYIKSKKMPVLYLLHGAGGNYAEWLKRPDDKNVVKKLSDLYQMIIVCADGGVTSWYYDSPADSGYRYETYITKELVHFIDQNYATIQDRSGRAIAGLSMGGHGALYLAFRNQQVYGACGSISGGVDIRPFPENWDLAKRLGSYSQYPQRWESNTVINLTHLLTPNKLAIIIDCGTGDFFYQPNIRLHEQLLERNIPHDFITRPGVHNFEYFGKALLTQALFISRFFEKTL